MEEENNLMNQSFDLQKYDCEALNTKCILFLSQILLSKLFLS